MISELVSRLIAAGTPPEIAAMAITEAFAAGANSIGNLVDSRLEKIRAADRERKRAKIVSTGNPPEFQRNDKTALTLTSLSESKELSEVKKEKKVRARGIAIPADYKPNQKHYEAADRLNLPHSAVDEKCEDMRLWATANGIIRPGWDATLHQFLRRDADKLRGKNGKGDVLAAADNLVERLRQFDQPAPAEQRQLCSGASEITLRPIPEG